MNFPIIFVDGDYYRFDCYLVVLVTMVFLAVLLTGLLSP
jgi:hypothetical protein